MRTVIIALLISLLAAASALPSRSEAALPEKRDQSAQLALWDDLQRFIASARLSGLAGTSFAADDRTVTLFWAGDVPKGLTDFAARRQSASRGAAVAAFNRVPYSQEQIVARANALLTAAKKRGIPIRAVSSTSDLTALQVDVDPSATVDQRAALRDLGASKITDAGPAVPLAARYDDTTPFWGGSVIETGPADAPEAWCSNGFAARTAAGTVGMVTTQHCGTNRDWHTPTVIVSGNTPVGRSNSGHSATDSMLITGSTYSAFIYRGPWDSSTGRAISFVGSAALNQRVCAGGGMSGEVCDATVHRINVMGPTGQGPGYFARTSSTSIPLAGQGDSGGPSFAVSSTTGNITMLGMVQSAFSTDKTGTCTGGGSNPWNVIFRPERSCYWNVFFVNASAVASGLGVTILTA